MDPLLGGGYGSYGGYGGLGGGGGGAGLPMGGIGGGPSMTWIVFGVSCCLLIVSVALYALGGGGGQDGLIIKNQEPLSNTQTTQAPLQSAPSQVREETIPTEEPDAKLATFAFESLTRPGMVPDKNGKLVRKPAGNPAYKFVQCGTSGYAIRWMGKYLTLYSANKLEWSETKQEPHSCFVTTPGYCGSDQFVMLRSRANKMFLRADESGVLVCKDTPTARTAKSYCWKLAPDVQGVQACGCQYSYDLQRVVCTPCDVKKMPAPGQSCETVTPGYRADCCVAKSKASPPSLNDTFCKTAAWPEVVGRSIKEVMLYLRTRRPDLTLRPCPAPCTVTAYPTPSPTVVVIPYDPRSGIVTEAARVLI